MAVGGAVKVWVDCGDEGVKLAVRGQFRPESCSTSGVGLLTSGRPLLELSL